MSAGLSEKRRLKVEQYEAFLNEQLKPDLQHVLQQRDKLYEEIAEYLALKVRAERGH